MYTTDYVAKLLSDLCNHYDKFSLSSHRRVTAYFIFTKYRLSNNKNPMHNVLKGGVTVQLSLNLQTKPKCTNA